MFSRGCGRAGARVDGEALEKMSDLLDRKKRRPFMVWFTQKSTTFKSITIMTLLTTIASGVVLFLNSPFISAPTSGKTEPTGTVEVTKEREITREKEEKAKAPAKTNPVPFEQLINSRIEKAKEVPKALSKVATAAVSENPQTST